MNLWTMHSSALEGLYQSRVTVVGADRPEAVERATVAFEKRLRQELGERSSVLGINRADEDLEDRILRKVATFRRLATRDLIPVEDGVLLAIL